MNIDDTHEMASYSSNCLALTIKKEYRITITSNVMKKSVKLGIKTIISGIVIYILNLFI